MAELVVTREHIGGQNYLQFRLGRPLSHLLTGKPAWVWCPLVLFLLTGMSGFSGKWIVGDVRTPPFYLDQGNTKQQVELQINNVNNKNVGSYLYIFKMVHFKYWQTESLVSSQYTDSGATFSWEAASLALCYMSPVCCILRYTDPFDLQTLLWNLCLQGGWSQPTFTVECRKAITSEPRIRLIQKCTACFLQVKTSVSGTGVYGPFPPRLKQQQIEMGVSKKPILVCQVVITLSL